MFRKCQNHLENVQENYWTHFSCAFVYSMRLFGAGFAALLHAFIPALCTHRASDAVKNIYHDMVPRAENCRENAEKKQK